MHPVPLPKAQAETVTPAIDVPISEGEALALHALCMHVMMPCMSRLLQVRGVPNEVHGTLRRRARQAGMSLSSYVLAELHRNARLPTRDEILERLGRRSPVSTRVEITRLVRKARETR